MYQKPRDTIMRTVSVYERDYNTLTLICKRHGFLNNNNQCSIRDAVAFLIDNFSEKIA